jgi:hypothetical protein
MKDTPVGGFNELPVQDGVGPDGSSFLNNPLEDFLWREPRFYAV